MGALRGLVFLMLLGVELGSSFSSPSLLSATRNHEHKITKTWNGQDHPDATEITVEFLPAPEGREAEGFTLKVEAPFYDDPRLPEGTPPGRFDGLWDYEVVEVFLLGPNETYVEIELAPSSNFLVYYLEGIREPTYTDWLIEYEVAKSGEGPAARWTGTAFIPWAYLPPCMNRFNAYAIHKSDDSRIYMSLFPAAEGAPAPDFHNLEPFSDIDLSDLGLPPSDPAECAEEDNPTTTEEPNTEEPSTTEGNNGSIQLVGKTGVIAVLLSFLLSIN